MEIIVPPATESRIKLRLATLNAPLGLLTQWKNKVEFDLRNDPSLLRFIPREQCHEYAHDATIGEAQYRIIWELEETGRQKYGLLDVSIVAKRPQLAKNKNSEAE